MPTSDTTTPNASAATTAQITPTEHEKREWSRFAQAAYHNDHNAIGHRFSTAACLRHGERMNVADFDSLQSAYRAWLVFNEYNDERAAK